MTPDLEEYFKGYLVVLIVPSNCIIVLEAFLLRNNEVLEIVFSKFIYK
jgi:hypothetical protein